MSSYKLSKESQIKLIECAIDAGNIAMDRKKYSDALAIHVNILKFCQKHNICLDKESLIYIFKTFCYNNSLEYKDELLYVLEELIKVIYILCDLQKCSLGITKDDSVFYKYNPGDPVGRIEFLDFVMKAIKKDQPNILLDYHALCSVLDHEDTTYILVAMDNKLIPSYKNIMENTEIPDDIKYYILEKLY